MSLSSEQPLSPRQIDSKFSDLEEFAAGSESNIKIVDRVRRLRMEVRRVLGLPPQRNRREAPND